MRWVSPRRCDNTSRSPQAAAWNACARLLHPSAPALPPRNVAGCQPLDCRLRTGCRRDSTPGAPSGARLQAWAHLEDKGDAFLARRRRPDALLEQLPGCGGTGEGGRALAWGHAPHGRAGRHARHALPASGPPTRPHPPRARHPRRAHLCRTAPAGTPCIPRPARCTGGGGPPWSPSAAGGAPPRCTPAPPPAEPRPAGTRAAAEPRIGAKHGAAETCCASALPRRRPACTCTQGDGASSACLRSAHAGVARRRPAGWPRPAG